MKVKDLIGGTVWTPGRDYSANHKPAVSVLLPTFRRAKSGLFRRAVQSVLDQTLSNIELIIVDDASTDGTADQIREFMDRDGRVSCLTHSRNIGLPAISEYEAFLKARSDFIAFAFDDTKFYPDALEKLLEHALDHPDEICFGHVVMKVGEYGNSNPHTVHLGSDLAQHNLRSWNVIPNNAVLLPRYVVSQIGFYDPHVLMARLCDWDLWCRIGEKYLLRHVDVSVGEEDGPSTNDSLGNTYPLDSWSSAEWMRRDRNVSLTPERLGEYEVFDVPHECSSETQSTIRYFTANHIVARSWMSEVSSESRKKEQEKHVLVLTSNHSACTSLYFDYLPPVINGHVRVIRAPGGLDITEIARASCLIVVRQIEIHKEWISAAYLLGIPCYFFLDDNFPLLQEEEKYKFSENFSVSALRNRLAPFAGVLLSTDSLKQYFAENKIHPNLHVYPPCYCGPQLIEKNDSRLNSGSLTVGFAGGVHRHTGLWDIVLPALKLFALDRQIAVHVVLAGCSGDAEIKAKDFESRFLTISCFPFELDWKRALIKLSKFHPDFVVHAPSETANNLYKTVNVALTACLLDALLLVPNDKPYDQSDFEDCSIRVAPPFQMGAWYEAFTQLLDSAESWSKLKIRNAQYCQTHFSGVQNVLVLRKILAATSASSGTLTEHRLKMLCRATGHKNVSQFNSKSEVAMLKASLLELAHIRKAQHRQKLLRFWRRKEDLWNSVSPNFHQICHYVTQEKQRLTGRVLELSESLHERNYAEYSITLRKGKVRRIICAFSSEGVHNGLAGLELVSSDNDIVFNSVVDVSNTSFHFPVVFAIDNLDIPQEATYRIRFFAKSEWPIYILEIVSYPRLRFCRKSHFPFASIEYDKAS